MKISWKKFLKLNSLAKLAKFASKQIAFSVQVE